VCVGCRHRAESGQATVEWVGLALLVSLLALGLAGAAGAHLPGVALARGIAQRIACAAGLGESGCAGTPDPELVAEYGAELAGAVRRHAPTLAYEDGMRAVPVDFRSCREDPCSLGAEAGEVAASAAGEPVTLFVHVVDCRPEVAVAARDAGYDCSGERAGNLYLQYWAYYPGSQSLRALPGDVGHHPDDWESLQLRLGPGAAEARASSHHGYNYTGGAGNWLSDAGISHRSAWGRARGRYFISGGSHAGHAWEEPGPLHRWTPGELVRLVPIEAVARGSFGRTRFAITAPWRKDVYRDPEYQGTD
jgi:hypothetical protein